MKEQITGYITGVINSYTRTIERLKKSGAPTTATNSFVSFKEEFSDLLEFVIDIPTESVTDTYVEINRLRGILAKEEVYSEEKAFEIILLRQRAAELEESYENMFEVEKDLRHKIERLEIENSNWKHFNNELNTANESLHKQIKILKTNFNLKQTTCNQLKNKLTDLRRKNK